MIISGTCSAYLLIKKFNCKIFHDCIAANFPNIDFSENSKAVIDLGDITELSLNREETFDDAMQRLIKRLQGGHNDTKMSVNNETTHIITLDESEFHKDFEHLQMFHNLKKLKIANIKIDNLLLNNLPSLEVLEIKKCETKRLSISGFNNLTIVECSGSQVSEIEIAELPKLKKIWIARCNTSNLKLPQKAESLEKIILKMSRLSNLALPISLPKLESLDISHNPIAQLPKSSLPALKELNLSYTDFTSWDKVDFISHPEKLEWFSVQINHIADLLEIEKHFPKLKTFSPFIIKDIELHRIFGKWCYANTEGMFMYSEKDVFVPNQAHYYNYNHEFDMKSIPSINNFGAKKHGFIDWKVHDTTHVRPNDKFSDLLPKSFYMSEKALDVRQKKQEDYYGFDSSDSFTYRFEVVTINKDEEKSTFISSESDRHFYEPVEIYLCDDEIFLNLNGPVCSRVCGVLAIGDLVLEAEHGQWNDSLSTIRWYLTNSADNVGNQAAVSGFYDENWVKIEEKTLDVRRISKQEVNAVKDKL